MLPPPPAKRTYDRFCPLSLALDQVGDRWTLHILMALLGGPKRYSELKRLLTGAGTNILTERLRQLAASGLVTRTTGNAPGSETRYQLTERGSHLGPVIGGLARWGLALLIERSPRGESEEQAAFDRTWTADDATATLEETYEWRIDGVTFALAVRGDSLTRTAGRAVRPAVTLTATSEALADVITGRQSVADTVAGGTLALKGSVAAVRRMFSVIGFPLARVEL